ncbi:LLM class flavin-dependent oxidoreductase [Neobacillus mesonae]|nr:LLM class flavin-dependent oxidoreductase [Neobacillus mesonae]
MDKKKPILSVLNLAPMRIGETFKQAIDSMVELAQAVEQMGYSRYWIAEHHNTFTTVSSATSILMKHTLDKTERIRVGSGGIMLPNHVPLVVAEQFGTMESLHPDRVDLGVGRAPGTDRETAMALRRTMNHSFFNDIQDLIRYFGVPEMQDKVRALPGLNSKVPLYILGSSTESAMLAAQLGLPYVFASHFAPKMMESAISLYRYNFQPSEYLDKPYVIIALNVIATESVDDAQLQKNSMLQFLTNMIREEEQPLNPPIKTMDGYWTSYEKDIVSSMTKVLFIGDRQSVRKQYIDFQERVNPDEIMVVTYIFDKIKQIRSYEIFNEIVNEV